MEPPLRPFWLERGDGEVEPPRSAGALNRATNFFGWALPEATARAHDNGQETKHEIDRNDVADLIQLLSGFGVCPPFDGLAKTAPRREEQVQEQQYHHNAHALHEVDMHPGAREPAEI